MIRIVDRVGEKRRLESFRTVEEAAPACDRAAEKVYGEFARRIISKPRKKVALVQPALPF